MHKNIIKIKITSQRFEIVEKKYNISITNYHYIFICLFTDITYVSFLTQQQCQKPS